MALVRILIECRLHAAGRPASGASIDECADAPDRLLVASVGGRTRLLFVSALPAALLLLIAGYLAVLGLPSIAAVV